MNSLSGRIQRIASWIVALVLITGCVKQAAPPGAVASTATSKPTLADARQGFVTKPGGTPPAPEAVERPPEDVFRLIKYQSAVGDLSAYLTPDPGDGQKHPAIIWITGGDCNSIGESWLPKPRQNDQSAAAYRRAGIVMMFPSLRGGNDNPGRREGFLGEVDDVIAASEFLVAQPYVDPSRIYLGGHSTGGTLAMLVAEISDRFRATFAFGPVEDVRGYEGRFVYHQPNDLDESIVSSPGYWLDSVRSPLFVIEGTLGNIDSLREMQQSSSNSFVRFLVVKGRNHFDVLAPANEAIAAEILVDTGSTMAINLTEQKLKGESR